MYDIYRGRIMKIKILATSIFGTVLLVLASLTPVIGTSTIQSQIENETHTSPLFDVRIQQSLNTGNPNKIQTYYLGANRALNIFQQKEEQFNNALNNALKMLEKNPLLTNQILNKLETNQIFTTLLKENDLTISDLKTYLNLIKNNPEELQKQIQNNQITIPEKILNPIMPKGLETTNPIGCFVTAMALAIVAVVLALIISTITIVTCLNIGGCFETIGQRILDSIAQGLIPQG